MNPSLPCPNCGHSITEENFQEYSNPFSMKCPSCDAKFKETKVTPWLLVLAVIVAPIFVFIGVTLQTYIAGFWPFIEKVPTAFVFLAFAYPFMLSMKNSMRVLSCQKVLYNLNNTKTSSRRTSSTACFIKVTSLVRM